MKIKYVFNTELGEQEYKKGFYNQSDVVPVLLLSDFEKAKDKVLKEIDDVIDNVELGMGENPVDEAYYDACLVMRKIVRKGFGVEK